MQVTGYEGDVLLNFDNIFLCIENIFHVCEAVTDQSDKTLIQLLSKYSKAFVCTKRDSPR